MEEKNAVERHGPMQAKHRSWLIVLGIVGALLLIGIGILVFQRVQLKRAYQKHPLKYTDMIEKYSAEYGLDPYLVTSVINVESGYRETVVSNKGAKGLMQIMPATGEWIAEMRGDSEFTVEQLDDPETNIRYGCWYLNYLYNMFKNTATVLASYNAGQGNVASWLDDLSYSKNGETLHAIPAAETEQYVDKVQNNYAQYKQLYPEAFPQSSTPAF